MNLPGSRGTRIAHAVATWLAGVLIVLVCSAQAEIDEGPAAPESDISGPSEGTEVPEKAAAQAAKNAESMPRDPFWPVGYVPGKAEETNPVPQEVKEVEVAPPRWKEATRSLKIKGVLRVSEGKYVAMINDRIVGEGDVMEAVFAGRRYRWKVKSVTREGVRFQPLESQVLGGS